MKQKSLFLMCGPSGSGKSTWINNQINKINSPYEVISRDKIRSSILKEGEEFFSHEDEVFDKFCNEINRALNNDNIIVFADATHLSEKSRNKTLDKINLNGVSLYVVDFELPVDICLRQNNNRIGKNFVPRSVVRRMHASYLPPTMKEKYKYKRIIKIQVPGIDNNSFYD